MKTLTVDLFFYLPALRFVCIYLLNDGTYMQY